MSAGDFRSFFDKKVSDIRASTSSTATPSFASTDCVISSFKQVTHDDVAAAVRAPPNKQCASDQIRTWLLKECSSELVPFLYRLVNASLSAGVVPSANFGLNDSVLSWFSLVPGLGLPPLHFPNP